VTITTTIDRTFADSTVRKMSEQVYWFVVLAGIYPAVVSDLLNPFIWHDYLFRAQPFPVRIQDHEYVWLAAILVGAFAGVVAFVQANNLRELLLGASRLFALAPLLFLLRLPEHSLAPTDYYAYLAYSFVCFLVATYFVVFGHVRSAAFALSAIVLFVLIAVDFYRDTHIISAESLTALYRFILFFLCVLFARLLYVAVYQNVRFFLDLGIKKIAILLVISVILWLPLGALLIPAQWLSNQISTLTNELAADLAIDAAKAAETPVPGCPVPGTEVPAAATPAGSAVLPKAAAPTTSPPATPAPASDASLESSQKYVGCVIDARFKTLDQETDAAFSTITGSVNEQADKTPLAGLSVFDKTVPVSIPGVGDPRKCKKWQFKCQIQQCLQSAYKRARSKERMRLETKLNKTRDDAKKFNQNAAPLAREEVKKSLRETQTSLKQSVAAFFKMLDLGSLFLSFLLFVAIVKSFMVVFARTAFSLEPDAHISVERGLAPIVNNAVTRAVAAPIHKAEGEYRIPLAKNEVRFCAKRYHPLNAHPITAAPQKLSLVFSRLYFGVYWMNRIGSKTEITPASSGGLSSAWKKLWEKIGTARGWYNWALDVKQTEGNPSKRPPEVIEFTGIQATEFVTWTLGPDEQVIFNLSNLVAMSETIKLSSIVSLELSTLLLGRLIFHCATGPGILLLKTQGPPTTSDDRDSSMAMPVHRLVAWHRQSRFKVRCELTIKDVFVSDIYVQKQPNDLIIIDADIPSTRAQGIARFMKTFLMPI
jgi:hypothetical protein